MQYITYNNTRQLPLLHQADVIVVGGGPGGIAAAVMAAREGAKVLLIERYGHLGGMAAQGMVTPFMHNHVKGRLLDQPFCSEWDKQMRKYREYQGIQMPIDANLAMLAAEDLCLEAGVQLLYHHTLTDALCEGNEISELVLFSKAGYSAARAKIYIDSTGDGDLAVFAGCEYQQGDENGHCQPMTTFFQLDGVDSSREPALAELQELYQAAKERGEISCPQEHIHPGRYFAADERVFNWTRVLGTVGTSGVELSRAEIEGRKQIREVLDFFHTHVPGYETCTLRSIAQHIGVRETRRIIGRAMLTEVSFSKAEKFPDAIAQVHYPVDIHNPIGAGVDWRELPPGEWYEIPFGCLVARDNNNLLVASRCISADHIMHSSLRIMPVVCSIGSAAGVAAANCVQRNCLPREIDGKEIRAKLNSYGAGIEE